MSRHFKYIGKAKRIRVQNVVLEKGATFSTDDPLLAGVLAGFPADIEEVKAPEAKEEKPAAKRPPRSDADRT